MTYDLIIRDALIVDGTGAPASHGDVAVRGDRIVRVGGSVPGNAAAEIVAAGAVLAPGFIDAHTHDDRLVLTDRLMQPKISQGVTTVVTGNCGISLAPMRQRDTPPPAPLTLLGGLDDYRFRTFGAYLAEVRRHGCATNIVPLVGHSSLRVSTMQDVTLPASAGEIEDMADLLREALAAGAFGLSTGLYYPTAFAAPAQEVEMLLREVANAGGITCAHIRDEGAGLFDALREAISIARNTRVPLVISHLKCASPQVWGASGEVLEMLEAAARDHDISFDVYPYEAGSSMLGPKEIADSQQVTISWSKPHPETAGRDLDSVAGDWCCSRQEAVQRLTPAGGIFFKMRDEDVRRILAHPLGMIGSDGLPHDAFPHPRLWGAFPRVLGRYVRDLNLLSLESAIRKMTALPARVFGLEGRGSIAEGMFADLALFDFDEIEDSATYQAPITPARGVKAVIVNGQVAWRDGGATGALPGDVLRRRPLAKETSQGRR